MWRGIISAAVLGFLLVVSGCGSSRTNHDLTSKQLASHIISAPSGYVIDPTTGANGQISSKVYDHYGGSSSGGFVAGFKQDYVDEDTAEGIAITVLEFASAPDAAAYFKATAYKTLSLADATYQPFSYIAGAVEADGTKAYGGEYSNAVVLTTGKFYLQLLYANADPRQKPIEFRLWVEAQWQLLGKLE
jgi:hypothetical protein